MTPRRARPMLGHPTYVAPRYQSNVWGRIIFALLILALCGIVGVGGGLYWMVHRSQSSSSGTVAVHVGSGDTVTSLANRLHGEGVVSNALLFRVDARLQGLSSELRPGDYSLQRNMSIDQMVGALGVYHVQYMEITVPPGWRLQQIAARVERYGIDRKSFLQAAEHPNLRLPILSDKPASAGLEGYLFPDTYKVPRNYSAGELVNFMVRTLGEKFTPALRAEARHRGWSVYKVLILASIVEREAKEASERPIIASVYANRLKQRIGLYADPTVQFAVGTPRNWWPTLTAAQLKTPSPYNTYLHGGWPPGPIASPGLPSIEAALHPSKTDYLFFVAKGNGYHAFARTLSEQVRNQQKYQPSGG